MSEQSAEFPPVYLDPVLQKAVCAKAATMNKTVSDVVNESVRLALQEDLEDLAAFEELADEPTMTYEDLLEDLRAHGKI